MGLIYLIRKNHTLTIPTFPHTLTPHFYLCIHQLWQLTEARKYLFHTCYESKRKTFCFCFLYINIIEEFFVSWKVLVLKVFHYMRHYWMNLVECVPPEMNFIVTPYFPQWTKLHQNPDNICYVSEPGLGVAIIHQTNLPHYFKQIYLKHRFQTDDILPCVS